MDDDVITIINNHVSKHFFSFDKQPQLVMMSTQHGFSLSSSGRDEDYNAVMSLVEPEPLEQILV